MMFTVPNVQADSTFAGPAYPLVDPTPFVGSSTNLGLAPQQWNSSVGLPIATTETPADQKIVIGEFDQTAK